MFKSGVWSRMCYATTLSQQRTLKRAPNVAKKRNKIKLVYLSNFINRRYTRTPLTRALVNRIYLRFEIFKSKHVDYAFLQVNDHLIRRIRGAAYRKLHNLLFLDEPFADELIEKHSNDPTSPTANGLHFDEDGRPIYGKDFNTMFAKTRNLRVRHANFYRLLDAKMHQPTVFFDFRPANVGHINTKLIFSNLNFLVPLNLTSRRPFSFTFLNYQPIWNNPLEPILRLQPNFIDLHPNRSSTEFVYKNRKLIILMGRTEKPLQPLSGFDWQANYLIPLYTNDRPTNLTIQQHYISEYEAKPNVELVYVPIEGVLRDRYGFDFSFYYYTLLALRDGLSLRESINQGFQRMNNGLQVYKQAEFDHRKSATSNYRFQNYVKKMPFKQFDSLEDELL